MDYSYRQTMAPCSVSDVGKVLFVFVVFMVTTSDGKNNVSPCQLSKSCTLLERMKAQDFDLDSKKRICYLAVQALLIPADDDCENPITPGVDTVKPPETLPETLYMCQLKQSCALMALTATPEDPHYETMKGVCQLAHKKVDVLGNITCQPVGMSGKESQCGSEEGTSLEITNDAEGPFAFQNQRPELSRTYYFDDCSEIYAAQTLFGSVSSGVYTIRPSYSGSFSVYCDMSTDGGAWTVIQRRFDGTLHFNRPFNDYMYGFGSASGEYWLGLQNMYRITAQNTYELYVELVDWSDNVRYAKYSSFGVGGANYYQLSLGSYSGNAGDSLGYSNGAKFSARDRDQDTHSSVNCATYLSSLAGGWWYKSCAHSAHSALPPAFRPYRVQWPWHSLALLYTHHLQDLPEKVQNDDPPYRLPHRKIKALNSPYSEKVCNIIHKK